MSVALGLTMVGCGAGPDERATHNRAMASTWLSDGLRLLARPSTSGVPTEGGASIRVNGAAVTMCLTNPTRRDHEVVISLSNLPPGPSIGCVGDQDPWVSGVASAEQTEPGVTVSGEALPTPCPALGLATLVPGPMVRVEVPAGQDCQGGFPWSSSLVVGSDPGPGVFRFAVVGDLLGREDLASSLAQELYGTEARFLIFLGNLVSSVEPGAMPSMADLLDSIGIPVYATVGPNDVRTGFMDRFGPTDSTFTYGGVRFVLLDSADGTLAVQQYDWLDQVLDPAARGTILCTHTAPFDPSGPRDMGFASHREAARLAALLASRGTDAIFASGIQSFDRVTVAGIPMYVTGATGSELWEDVGPHFLMVEVDTRGPRVSIRVEVRDL